MEEHKWLGYDACNLANSLNEEGMCVEACPVLDLGCDELLIWCKAQQDVLQGLLEVSDSAP